MVNVEIRNESVIIDGIVNCTEKDSKPIPSISGGRFLEQIQEGVFTRAIEKADNVLFLLNHDYNRQLSSTNDGVQLWEDGVGLHIRAEISDSEVIQAARNNALTGFSFGFRCLAEVREAIDKKGCNERRIVTELELREVSLLCGKRPAYTGCCVEVRGEDEFIQEQRNYDDIRVYGIEEVGTKENPVEENNSVDYTDLEVRLNQLRKAD